VQLRERPLVQSVAVVAALLCVLFAAAPPFLRNLRASRLAEPMDRLSYIGSRATLIAAGRPVESAYPGAAPLTPAVVPKGELVLDPPGTWDHPTWRLLDFRVEEPHAFSFAFESENGPDVSRFRATARGDLDGDGNLSTFSIAGESPKGGAPSSGPLAMHREVE
jgi:hypothetical protein